MSRVFDSAEQAKVLARTRLAVTASANVLERFDAPIVAAIPGDLRMDFDRLVEIEMDLLCTRPCPGCDEPKVFLPGLMQGDYLCEDCRKELS